jgi:phosphoglycerate dehydrogenase-like enzyme
MDRPTLVVLCRRGRASLKAAQWAALDAVADVRVVQRHDAPGPDEAAALLAGADLLGTTNLCLPRLDAELLSRLPRLRGVVLYATGYDLLDVPLLERAGVGLSVLPDYATRAVAEHGLALLLALATRLHLAHDRSRGLAPAGVSLRGVELGGRTLGVVGVGRIGLQTAALARAFGMEVVGCDTDATARWQAAAHGIEVLALDELLRRSDAVSVCASTTYGGGAVLRRREIGLLQSHALLVNTARPWLVDLHAVTSALRSGRLAGYGVDDTVLDPLLDADLLEQGRVLQTGHSAWWRDEAMARGAQMWGERLHAAAVGAPLDAVLWPQRPPVPA